MWNLFGGASSAELTTAKDEITGKIDGTTKEVSDVKTEVGKIVPGAEAKVKALLDARFGIDSINAKNSFETTQNEISTVGTKVAGVGDKVDQSKIEVLAALTATGTEVGNKVDALPDTMNAMKKEILAAIKAKNLNRWMKTQKFLTTTMAATGGLVIADYLAGGGLNWTNYVIDNATAVVNGIRQGLGDAITPDPITL